jgi:circadian clock protein KaiB
MSQRIMYKFRLYIADGVQNSAQAVTNLTALCRAHLPDRHEIEVVDVFREPKRALADRILMTPTLVRVEPSPVRRVVGTLSQTQPVLQALGLETLAT